MTLMVTRPGPADDDGELTIKNVVLPVAGRDGGPRLKISAGNFDMYLEVEFLRLNPESSLCLRNGNLVLDGGHAKEEE